MEALETTPQEPVQYLIEQIEEFQLNQNTTTYLFYTKIRIYTYYSMFNMFTCLAYMCNHLSHFVVFVSTLTLSVMARILCPKLEST